MRRIGVALVALASLIGATTPDGSQSAAPTGAVACGEWPSWSPDGQWLAVRTSFSPVGLYHGPTIWLLRCDGSEARWPIRRFDLGEASWSPDGQLLAVERQGKLLVHDLRSGRAQYVVPQPCGRPATWSPDGKRLAFIMARDGARRLYVAKIDPAAARWATVESVVTPRDLEVTAAAWSPTGDDIAFVRQRPLPIDTVDEVCLVKPEGGQVRLVWRLPSARRIERLSWAPDARGLYCSVSSWGRAMSVEITQTIPAGILDYRTHQERFDQAVFLGPGGRTQAEVIAVERRLGGFYAVMPNGGFAVYRYVFDFPDNLVLLDSEHGTVTAVPCGSPAAGLQRPKEAAISPDGRQLAMVINPTTAGSGLPLSRLFAGSVDGTGLHPLVIRPVGIEHPFVVTPLEPAFPLVHRCRLKTPQTYSVQVFPDQGWATVEAVRFVFRRPDQPEREVGVEYDVAGQRVAVVDKAGTQLATLSPGSEEEVRADGVAVSGKLCAVQPSEQSGQVRIGLAFEAASQVGEWNLTVRVRGKGQQSESPVLGWVQVHPETSEGKELWERLQQRGGGGGR